MDIPQEVIDAFDAVFPGHGPIEQSTYCVDGSSEVWPLFECKFCDVTVSLKHLTTRGGKWKAGESYVYTEPCLSAVEALHKELHVVYYYLQRCLQYVETEQKEQVKQLAQSALRAEQTRKQCVTFAGMVAKVEAPTEWKVLYK